METMSIIQSVIIEEFERLKRLKNNYNKEIEALPRGAVSKRKRGARFYLYLIYRSDKKVVTKYVGNWESEKAKAVLKQVRQRQELEQKLKQVNRDLAETERALRAKQV